MRNCETYIRGVSPRDREIIADRRNREYESSLPVKKSRESARGGKTNAPREGKRRKAEKRGEGEHLTGNIYTVYELAGASDRRGTARRRREADEEGREEEKAEAHESKTVAVYGRFYGVTRRGTTVLLLSISAIEIGCLLIGICLSPGRLMIPRAGRI